MGGIMSGTKLDSFPELRHLNAILSAIRNVNQLIVFEKDRAQLIRKSCMMLIETENFLSAWIVLYDTEGA